MKLTGMPSRAPRTSNSRDQPRRRLLDRRRPQAATRRVRSAVEAAQHEVVLDRQARREAGAQPVLRHVREPRTVARLRPARRAVVAVDRDRPRGGCAQPGDRLVQLALPVARHAGDAHDLAAPHSERHPVHRGPAVVAFHHQPVDGEHNVARCVRRALRIGRRRRVATAEHHRRQRGLRERGRVARSGVAARPQHGHPVGVGQDLLHLVRHQHHRVPGGHHPPHRDEQPVALVRREHRGRLVEDQDPRPAVQLLEDLDTLALTHRQLPHRRRRVHLQPVLIGQPLHPLLHVAASRAAPPQCRARARCSRPR